MPELKHTPGPWQWELNLAHKTITLCGGIPMFDKTVMDFERWGMSGAAPRFNSRAEDGFNFMERSEKFAAVVEGREHHKHWFQTISNPDAKLIAAAPDLLEALQALLNVDALNPHEQFAAESKAVLAIQKATT